MRLFSSFLLAGLVALTGASSALGQSSNGPVRRHLLYFTDKAGTPYTVAQPQNFLSARAIQRRTRQGIAVLPRDLPVSATYVAQVRAVAGASVWYTSKWFNAAVVSCDSATLTTLRALPFVRSAQTLNRTNGVVRPLPTAAEDDNLAARTQAHPVYGRAYEQARMIGAVALHNAGFRGEGMQIAVLDDGFPTVNTTAPFASLRTDSRILDTYNFADRNSSVYIRDSHGTNTLSTMAANEAGVQVGTAPKASYRLYITEDVFAENPIEEINWLLAAERADSAGVDIISSSLGYSTFDTSYGNYTYANLNGRTALSTRAATVAARVGMVVVNSAGNEGRNAWQHILAPADADSILAVGAVDSLRNYAGFSSTGPSADGRVKPNLATQGHLTAIINTAGQAVRGSGTSFACPVLAGMVACFWQANPTLTAQQVISFLQRSASQYTTPDALLGFGIPNAVTAYNLANPGAPLAAAAPAAVGQLAVYPNPAKDDELYLDLPESLRAVPLRVRFYDARGVLVAEQTLRATSGAAVRLRPGPLARGVYSCEVQATGKAPQSVRFVRL